MPKFSRPFRFMNRLFPPAGAEFPNPRFVSDTIQLTHEILKPSFVGGVRFVSFFNTALTGGVTTILNAHLNPPTGFILFPVLLNLRYDGGAVIIIDVRVTRITGAETDPWGDWLPTLAAGAAQLLGSVHTRATSGSNAAVHAPTIPIPNNNQIECRFVNPALGTNVFTDFYGVLIPGELVSPEMWRSIHTNFVWNVAL